MEPSFLTLFINFSWAIEKQMTYICPRFVHYKFTNLGFFLVVIELLRSTKKGRTNGLLISLRLKSSNFTHPQSQK
jgi:hypothetical protein